MDIPHTLVLIFSNFHIFGPLKDTIHEKRYGNDKEVMAEVSEWPRPLEF